jgi:sugar phosphate permease
VINSANIYIHLRSKWFEKVNMLFFPAEKLKTNEQTALPVTKKVYQVYASCLAIITSNITIWCLFISNICVNFALKAMADWTGLYLTDYCGYTLMQSIELMMWNEVIPTRIESE